MRTAITAVAVLGTMATSAAARAQIHVVEPEEIELQIRTAPRAYKVLVSSRDQSAGCKAPCTLRMQPGEYFVNQKVLDVSERITLSQNTTLWLRYYTGETRRTVGGALLVIGLLGGVLGSTAPLMAGKDPTIPAAIAGSIGLSLVISALAVLAGAVPHTEVTLEP